MCCVFVVFLSLPDKLWYLIVSIHDLCHPLYFGLCVFLCVVFSYVFVTSGSAIWYLIVSIHDLCLPPYFWLSVFHCLVVLYDTSTAVLALYLLRQKGMNVIAFN